MAITANAAATNRSNSKRMKRIVYILLMVMGMATIAPIVSLVDNTVATAHAVDARAKAQAQREKEKAKRQKEREKAKAKAAKEREKASAQKKKEQAKAAAQRQKEQEKRKAQAAKAADARKKGSAAKASKPAPRQEQELSAAEEKAQYMAVVADIEKKNERVIAYLNRDISHRLGFWGQVGYSNLFTKGIRYAPAAGEGLNPDGFMNKDKGFVGGGLGLGYQLRYKQFLMTVGAEFNFYNSVMGISNQEAGAYALQYGMAPYTSSMTYHYDFAKLNDKLIGGFVQVPLLFGMELKDLPLFWQAGLKIGMGVMGQSTLGGLFSTTIEDKELIDGLTDMYNHTLVTDRALNAPATKVKFGLNMAASAEVGVNLDQWVNALPKLRASLFVDYGFLNSLSYKPADNAQDIPTRMLESANPLDFPVNSALATASAADAKVNPFLVGVKFAVWFELPRKHLETRPMPEKPQPRLGVFAFDDATGKALGGASVEVTEISADKTKHKNSNKQGIVKVGRVPEGEYRVAATKNGYFPSDTVLHMVEEFTFDTIRIPLRRIPAPVVYTLCMNIYDAETKEPIEAMARLTAIQDSVVLYAAQSSDDGFIETPLREGNYIAHLSAQGYMPQEDTLRFVRDTFDLYMQHIKEGIKVKIENLFFATNKTVILPQSEQAMSDLATFLLENPSVKIHITGHTDAVGTDEANQILSEGRANAVRNDLIQRGVAAERMTAEGKGEKEPVADNDTEEGRQLNRRVEFVIIDVGNKDIQQVF